MLGTDPNESLVIDVNSIDLNKLEEYHTMSSGDISNLLYQDSIKIEDIDRYYEV